MAFSVRTKPKIPPVEDVFITLLAHGLPASAAPASTPARRTRAQHHLITGNENEILFWVFLLCKKHTHTHTQFPIICKEI